MVLIEALQKWNKVTNDGGKTVYSTTSGGHVVRCTDELGGVINPTIKLLTSTGWAEYSEPLILPEMDTAEEYYYIDEFGNIESYINYGCKSNHEHFGIYNYIPNKALAMYMKDKQLIQRVYIILYHLNKDNPDKEILISEYIRDNYKEIIDRIKEYEVVQFIGGRHNV